MWNSELDEEQESRLLGEIPINIDNTTLMTESKKELMKVKEESEKADLKPNIQNSTFKKRRSCYPVPSLHGK